MKYKNPELEIILLQETDLDILTVSGGLEEGEDGKIDIDFGKL